MFTAQLADASHGAYRIFQSPYCGANYTLYDLMWAFSAHSVEWNLMGRDEPWFSVLTSPHLRGQRDIAEKNKESFYASGFAHVEAVMGECCEDSPVDVLDFGCGLARLGMAFARHQRVRRVYCVDQSVHHLRVASHEWRNRARAEERDKLKMVLSTPDLQAAMRGRRVQFVHSVLVLQHMVPPLQQVYLEQLCDLLTPGGRGWIQIPTKCAPFYQAQSKHPCNLRRSIEAGGMQMHWTPARYFAPMLAARGCSVRIEDVGSNYLFERDDPNWRAVILHLLKSGPG